MPHVDELLGVATVAAAGMFAAIAISPLAVGTTRSAAHDNAAVASVAAQPVARPSAAQTVSLPGS